jgi:hypothetical protein
VSPEVEPRDAQLDVKIGIIRGQLASILAAAGGLESNVQYPSPYWFLMNQLKSLTRQL